MDIRGWGANGLGNTADISADHLLSRRVRCKDIEVERTDEAAHRKKKEHHHSEMVRR